MTTSTRGLWIALTIVLGIVTGICGGVLASLGGDNAARAVITGAATFAGTVTLATLVLSFVASSSERRP